MVVSAGMSKRKAIGTLDHFILSKKANNSQISNEPKETPQEDATNKGKDPNHRVQWKQCWTEGRSWLKYDSEKKVMLCLLCKKYGITTRQSQGSREERVRSGSN